MTLRFSPTRNASSLAVVTSVVFSLDEEAVAASSAALDAVLGSTPNLFAVRGTDQWEQRAIVGSDLPNPSTTTLGGVFSLPVETNSVLSGIGNDGTPTRSTTTGTGNVVRATSPTITSPTVATSLGVTGPVTVTSNSSAALAVGSNGVTNPALQVDASLASSATGLSIISQSAASAVVNVSAISSGANASLTFDAKGSGTIDLGITSTGNIECWRDVNIMPGNHVINFFGSTSGFTILKPAAVASGTIILPAATDTLVGKATTDAFTNKTFDTAGTGNSFSINGVAVTANLGTGAVIRSSVHGVMRLVAVGVNFNSANTDTDVTFSLPSGIIRWRMRNIYLSNASASISTATIGVFTGAGGTGQTIAANQAITVTATAVDTNNNFMSLAITNGATMAYNDTTIRARVGTAQGSAATADVIFQIDLLS